MSERSRDELPSVSDINKMIHEPARLLIMAHLYVVENADFLFLMRQTGMTFGNLLHRALSHRISFDTSLEQAITAVIDKSKVDLLTSNISEKEAHAYFDTNYHILSGFQYKEGEKEFKGKKPNTKLSLTESGRKAFEGYRQNMRQLFTESLENKSENPESKNGS